MTNEDTSRVKVVHAIDELLPHPKRGAAEQQDELRRVTSHQTFKQGPSGHLAWGSELQAGREGGRVGWTQVAQVRKGAEGKRWGAGFFHSPLDVPSDGFILPNSRNLG